jgi:CDP-diacylglycerol--glycerol-3-phosphate 3-phosphatidyltransferase
LSIGDPVGGLITYAAAAGSVLVSYVKSRAETLGYTAKIGILTRAERYLVLAPSLVLSYWIPNLVYIGLGIIAIFANITALQRIWHVRGQFHAKMQKKI